MSLKTDYRDDIYEGSRRWRITQNEDGTYNISDATSYTQKGDKFGQNDINAITGEINRMTREVDLTLRASGWSASAPYTQTVAVEGLTAGDNPILVKVIPAGATPEQVKAYNKAFGMIDDGDTADGQATFRCFNKKPAVDMTVGLKGV